MDVILIHETIAMLDHIAAKGVPVRFESPVTCETLTSFMLM